MSLDTISINDVFKFMSVGNTILIDLREPGDYHSGHIPGAINIPYSQIRHSKKLLDKYFRILLYCERGNVSLKTSRELAGEGYPVINLYGGIHTYRGKLVR